LRPVSALASITDEQAAARSSGLDAAPKQACQAGLSPAEAGCGTASHNAEAASKAAKQGKPRISRDSADKGPALVADLRCRVQRHK
jgi:hypothetical protein